MRNLLLQIVVFGLLPVIPFYPFLGLVTYSWLAYMRPHDLAWGISSARYSLYVAVATLVGAAIAALLKRERLIVVRPQTVVLILLGGWVAISGYTAVAPELSRRWVELFLKVIVISVLTTGLVTTRRRFRWLLVTITFSLGFLGAKYAFFGLVRGGAQFDTGPGGFMIDNNLFALALCMVIPLLAGVATVERSRALRRTAIGLVVLSALTVVFTFSRGGMLALAVVGALSIARSKSRWGLALGFVLVIGLFLLVLPESFQASYGERAQTVTKYAEDGSALGRIDAWKTSLRMSRDYPLFGVGPDNFVSQYSSYGQGQPRVNHNAFLQLLSESGIPALALFCALLVVTAWRLQRLVRQRAASWIRIYAQVFQISLAGYVTAGMFLNMAYFDLLYHLVALSVSLEVLAAQEGESNQAEATEVAGELPWWQQPRGAYPSSL